MTDSEKILKCLLDYYMKWKKDPEAGLTVCPFEMSEGIGAQLHRYGCIDLCFAFDALKTPATDFVFDCPCEHYGTYGAFEQLEKVLIEHDMLKGPRKQDKVTKKYGWLHFFFHRWNRSSKTFRKCKICGKSEYKIYTDSGTLSCWLDLS